MSIKGYVFLLFAALILLLGMSQVFVAYYFKSQLQAELEQSSKQLSQNLVKVVVDRVASDENWEMAFDSQVDFVHIDDGETDGNAVSEDVSSQEFYVDSTFAAPTTHSSQPEDMQVRVDNVLAENAASSENLEQEIERLHNEILTISEQIAAQAQINPTISDSQLLVMTQERLSHALAALMAQEAANVEAERQQMRLIRQETAKEYEQKIRETLAQIDVHTEQWLSDGNVVLSDNAGPLTVTRTTSVNLPNQGANLMLERFGESLLMMILVTSFFAMLLAYWLSHHVTQPLSALAKGHQQLGQGNLGIQIKEQGVKELKLILQGFNTMSAQLAAWNDKVQLMSQQQHLADLGQVARGIAHSLRNPLHTLGLLSEQASATDSAAQRQVLDSKIQQKITLMDKNIQTLLTVASDAVNRDKLVPVNGIIHDILLEISISGCAQRIVFDTHQIEMQLAAAESEIRSILHAVIVNAVEASTGMESIHINCSETEQHYQITVTDRGAGIAPQIRHQLFEPHISTKPEGSGMGLYLAKRLIVGHYGGDIICLDNPEGGTTMKLLFAKHRGACAV